MSKSRSLVLSVLSKLAICVSAILILGLASPALGAGSAKGAKIFSNNCASCHRGGGNIIIAHKTLKQPALEKYGMNSKQAIMQQVLHGKNAMPAFRGRLDSQQLEDVAIYVLEKAETGW